MTGKGLKNFRILLLVVSAFLVGVDAFRQWQMLSKEEKLELNRQFKLLNKPAIKSFRTDFGDVIDCVDIYKQPALDHPLLKNHTIQIKPSIIPEGLIGDAPKAESLLQYFTNINRCPPGAVPIRRTRKEDLLAARSLKPLRSYQPTDNLRPSTTIDVDGYHIAVLNYEAEVFGAKSQINVWNPTVSNDQYSTASMWLSKGTRDQQNTIQLGWGVVPQIYQNVSRLNIYWTADGYQNTGCYNQLCPGFVQISTEIIPGLPLSPISTYNGPQYDIPVSVHQDISTGNWLFMFGNKYVGYWPKALLPGLTNGAAVASWGGGVYSPTSKPSPAMGSGHFPEEGYRKCAYVNQIQVAGSVSRSFVDPIGSELTVVIDKPVCYGAIHKFMDAGNWGHHIYFGGPADCK